MVSTLKSLIWRRIPPQSVPPPQPKKITDDDTTEEQSQLLQEGTEEEPQDTRQTRKLIASVSALGNIVCCGCFLGEFMVKNVASDAIVHNEKITPPQHTNAIVNYIELVNGNRNSLEATDQASLVDAWISENDSILRNYEISASRIALVRSQRFPYCINHATIDPTRKLVVIAGDEEDLSLTEASTGKIVGKLKGHMDFPFSTSWNPVQHYYLASAAQDKSVRIWDIRMLGNAGFCGCITTLKGTTTSIRCVRYSHDGMLLGASESADMVHIYSVADNFEREQVLDLMGEISSFDFSPDSSSLFVAIADSTYNSIIEFSRVRRSLTDEVLL